MTGYLGPKKKKTTEKIYWSTEGPPLTGRARKCDTIDTGRKKDQLPGKPSGWAAGVKTMKEAFDLMFDEEMMDLVVEKTNLHIEQYLLLCPNELLYSAPYLKKTTKVRT